MKNVKVQVYDTEIHLIRDKILIDVSSDILSRLIKEISVDMVLGIDNVVGIPVYERLRLDEECKS